MNTSFYTILLHYLGFVKKSLKDISALRIIFVGGSDSVCHMLFFVSCMYLPYFFMKGNESKLMRRLDHNDDAMLWPHTNFLAHSCSGAGL